MIGRRLLHYEITEKLGEGGMGVVYKAKDTHLDRFVALKVLPPERLTDGSRRGRFVQEARAASALHHPNIITVHDIAADSLGETSHDFIVMEYVAGKTLDQLIPRKGMRLNEALKAAVQIADALACAHSAGIVHRDLKPSNIILDEHGLVKVLDFGLAKLIEEARSEVESTATMRAKTDERAIVGTTAYMSPEQAQAQRIDGRSDIFSFGCVLYEMITGRRAFSGANPVSTLAAIIAREPRPPHDLVPRLPPELERILLRCLRKDPARRFQHMDDVRVALDELKEEIESRAGGGVAQAVGLRRRKLTLLTLAVGTIAAIAIAYLFWGNFIVRRARTGLSPADRSRLRLVVAADGELLHPSLSPDGMMVAYVAPEQGRTEIFVQRVAGGARIRLTNDNTRKERPRFTPDGERISFTRYNSQEAPPEICLVPALGGETMCLLSGAVDAAWSPDGRRLAFVMLSPGEPERLGVAASDGSGVRVLFRGDAGHPFVRTPTWSPRSNQIGVVLSTGGMDAALWLVPVTGGPSRPVIANDSPGVFSSSPVFSPDGSTLIHQSNRAGATNLWAVRLADGALVRITTGAGPDETPSVARNGVIAFANPRSRASLFLHNLETGRNREIFGAWDIIWAPAFSPDGQEVAFSRGESDGSWHIWSVSAAGGGARRLTAGPLPEIYSRFSPNGEDVLFHTWSPGPDRLWCVSRRGGPPQALTPVRPDDDQYGDFSPDGRWIAFARTENDKTCVYVARANGGDTRLLVGPESTLPRWSPDGQWIAFSRSRRFSVGGIYIVRADGTALRCLSETGSWPVWWPDGSRLSYLGSAQDGTEQIFTVALAEGAKPALFSGLRFTGWNHPFDISHDGRYLASSDTVALSTEIWLLEPESR